MHYEAFLKFKDSNLKDQGLRSEPERSKRSTGGKSMIQEPFFLESNRLKFRPITVDDADDLARDIVKCCGLRI